MRESSLLPFLLFLTLLLPRRPELWVVFGGLTATYYLNLWYILRALNAERFLERYDPFGVAVSVVNVGLFLFAAFEGWRLTRVAPAPLPLPELGDEGEIEE